MLQESTFVDPLKRLCNMRANDKLKFEFQVSREGLEFFFRNKLIDVVNIQYFVKH